MRILFDTNVIIDAAVPSRSYHDVALELFSRVDRGKISGLAAAGAEAGAEMIATRNEKDFDTGILSPHHPQDLARMLRQ